MNRHIARRLAFLAGVAVAVTLLPLAASADDAKRVVIVERNQLVAFDPATGAGRQEGTFSAAGAISDSGTATSDFTVTPFGNDRATIVDGDHVLESAQGTLVARSNVTIFPFPSARVISEGTWEIVSATGAYAGLKGKGTSLAVGDFTTGAVTIMRDGKVRFKQEAGRGGDE